MKFRIILAAALSAVSLFSQPAPKVTFTPPRTRWGSISATTTWSPTTPNSKPTGKKLASESDRMKLVSIGKTEEGRDQWMAIITSPANLKNLDHYKQISARLAHAEGVTEEQAHQLASEGKAVVWSGRRTPRQ